MKKIKKHIGAYIILPLLFSLFNSCKSSEYILKKDHLGTSPNHEFISGSSSSSSNGINSYYASSSSSNALKPIFISLAKFENLNVSNIDSILSLCNGRKFSKAKKMLLTNSRADNATVEYINALILFLQFKYAESSFKLSKMNAANLDIDVQLLLLDNEFEMQKIRNAVNVSYFIQKYQAMIDTQNLSEEYVQVVDTRVKYLRYYNN